MNYQLLTGATGLLGSYLLRDAAALEIPLAVVVRPSRTESARQRIESQLARWEQISRTCLPRPVILEGNLNRPQLGLSADQMRWVAQNCSGVIHNAASLSFVAKDEQSEPYLSNVDGTRHVLDLCQQTGIRHFHHVSTAYICGLRNGIIYEAERNIGQTPGNDYERSKIMAEEMVASADYLDQKTFFRPGIIIGDSRTGYTSTFHGFYVPLKICHGLMSLANSFSSTASQGILHWFNLNGSETKNFVPVDWVSAVMMRVIAQPEYHGKTYHLTPTNRTLLSDMAEAIGDVILNSNSTSAPAESNVPTPSAEKIEYFRQTFLNQMQVYQSYWRDDPEFDRLNTLAVTQDLPCPTVDKKMLVKMCRYAIESNFGWPIEPPRIPGMDSSQLHEKINAGLSPSHPDSVIGLMITGPGGGDWELQFAQGKLVGVQEGISSDCLQIARLNSQTLQQLLSGVQSVQQAAQVGRLYVEFTVAPHEQQLFAALEEYVQLAAREVSEDCCQDGSLVQP